MIIRCKQCHGSVWVQPVYTDSGDAVVSCRECNQRYVLETWDKVRSSTTTLAERAHRLAREQKVDLPGAYSILLGILTVDELRELGDSGSTSCRTSTEDGGDPGGQAGRGPRGHYRYDRAFQPAIDSGFLTQRQAAERGKRDAYAGILASRHRFPMDIAYQVADNRTSLLEALRGHAGRGSGEMRVSVGSGRRLGLLLALLAGVVLMGLLVKGSVAEGPGGAIGALHSYAGAEIKTDGGGRIVQVVGPDPRSVLRAFCAAGPGRGRLQSVGVVSSSLHAGRARLGLLRDDRDPEKLLAIQIREDRTAGHWVAGSGDGPLQATAAPSGAEEALTPRRPAPEPAEYTEGAPPAVQRSSQRH